MGNKIFVNKYQINVIIKLVERVFLNLIFTTSKMLITFYNYKSNIIFIVENRQNAENKNKS